MQGAALAAVFWCTFSVAFAKEEEEAGSCTAPSCTDEDSISEMTLLQTQLKMAEPQHASFMGTAPRGPVARNISIAEWPVARNISITENVPDIELFEMQNAEVQNAEEAAKEEGFHAQVQQARLNVLKTMSSRFFRSSEGAVDSEHVGLTTIQTICDEFRLDATACGRVRDNLGPTAHVTEPVTVHAHTSSATDFVYDEIFASTLGEFSCPLLGAQENSELEKFYAYPKDFCKAIADATRSSAPIQKLLNRRVLFSFGDHHAEDRPACFPTFFKSRLAERPSQNVVLDLNHDRHWEPVSHVVGSDRAHNLKMNKLVWRGATSGGCDETVPGSRMYFVKKFFRSPDPRIDVGYNIIFPGCDEGWQYKVNSMNMSELLEYKYIMLVNGNDKASALNWVLASRSVPFMVKPTVESWLLESSLRPGVHYVEVLPDFSDLQYNLDWADGNPDLVEKIAENGRQYMSRFNDATTEANVQGATMTAYLERVSIVDVEPGEMEDNFFC